MLLWMRELTLRDIIRIEDIRKDLGVANIEEKRKENRLGWFWYVQRQNISKPISKIERR